MSRTSIDNERGAILAAVGIGLVAVLAMVGYGFGLGRLALAASEVQNAADAAALAGATALLRDGDPWNDASLALQRNSIESWDASGDLDEIKAGMYRYETKNFQPGGLPTNAVRARVTSTVSNGLAALLGTQTTNVQKISYAAFSGLRGGRPTLPIVIGECHFQEDCYDDSCMPHLTQVPDPSDSSAWTGFFGGANVSTALEFFPNTCRGIGRVQEVWIGDTINIANGQDTPLLRAIDCLYDMGVTQHIIPIVNCDGTFNQSRRIVGFATIIIDDVVISGGRKGVYLHAIFKSNATGALGGKGFGTGNIALVPVAN